MIGGQVEDLEAEGKPVVEEQLLYIHRSKTGALIAAAVRMGGVYGCADESHAEALAAYGEDIGLAFQITDDILDVTFHRYPTKTVLLLFYRCALISGEVKNLQVADHAWVSVPDLGQYPMPPADEPVLAKVRALAPR